MVKRAMLLKMLLCKRRREKAQKMNTSTSNQVRIKTEPNSSFDDWKLRCRVCLRFGRIPIFGDMFFKDISESLNLICGINVTNHDMYPQHLCHTCYMYLDGAITLKENAQNSNEKLRSGNAFTDESDELYSNMSILFEDNEPLVTSDYDNSEHIDSTEIKCNEDQTVKKGHENIQGIKKESNTQKSYHCELCNLCFDSLSAIYKHRRTLQHQKASYACPFCNKICHIYNYKRHMTTHSTNFKYMCDVCGKKFVQRAHFVKHAQIHTNNLPYQCNLCPYRGRFPECLKLHMKTHTGEKPYQCSECPVRCITKSNLNRHMLTHKKVFDFECKSCGKGFFSKSRLAEHFKVYHAGIKDYNCDICGKAFGTRKQMMKHQLKVHKREKLRSGRTPIYLTVEQNLI